MEGHFKNNMFDFYALHTTRQKLYVFEPKHFALICKRDVLCIQGYPQIIRLYRRLYPFVSDKKANLSGFIFEI